jgi:type VI secretion system protein ImpM
MNESTAQHPGIYGKLPSHGDFVTRRLPASFVEPWDHWLQEAITSSRSQIGDRWLDIYLTSPLWRFVLASGVSGQSAWAGVLMPSVDRVGRYFPLTLATALPRDVNPFVLMNDMRGWFTEAEVLLLSCLEDGFDLDAFDKRLFDLGPPITPSYRGNAQSESTSVEAKVDCAWRIEIDDTMNLKASYPGLLTHSLRALFFAYSIWCTQGSERVKSSLLVFQGLPPTDSFAALLAGDWEDRGW